MSIPQIRTIFPHRETSRLNVVNESGRGHVAKLEIEFTEVHVAKQMAWALMAHVLDAIIKGDVSVPYPWSFSNLGCYGTIDPAFHSSTGFDAQGILDEAKVVLGLMDYYLSMDEFWSMPHAMSLNFGGGGGR